MPDSEPDIAPGDTARIASARVVDIDQIEGEAGRVTRIRFVELDIRGRSRLFIVTIDRGTGKVLQASLVHR